jgi:hypothetical protein
MPEQLEAGQKVYSLESVGLSTAIVSAVEQSHVVLT